MVKEDRANDVDDTGDYCQKQLNGSNKNETTQYNNDYTQYKPKHICFQKYLLHIDAS
jgi:hypothetical protein